MAKQNKKQKKKDELELELDASSHTAIALWISIKRTLFVKSDCIRVLAFLNRFPTLRELPLFIYFCAMLPITTFWLLCSGLHLCLRLTEASNSELLSPFNTPLSKIKLPKKAHSINYKGSLFSYTSQSRELPKPIRHYVLENESVKNLEDSFIDHLTDIIVTNLSRDSFFDPLKLKPIQFEPIVGNDVFRITLNDIQISGLSDVDIHDLRPKLSALKLRVALLFPRLSINAHFHVNGTWNKVLDVAGEGYAQLEYTNVLLRTQIGLLHENATFQIANSDPPLVDFHSGKMKLSRHSITNETAECENANEISSLLFWVLADNVVQQVDDYILKYINDSLQSFKVPQSFKPVITWLINRNAVHQSPMSQFQIGRFSPLPFLNHWINSLSSNLRQPGMNTPLFA